MENSCQPDGLSEILDLTVNVRKILQTKSIDRQYVGRVIENVILVLEEKRSNAERQFKAIFELVCDIHEKMEIDIHSPRIIKRQYIPLLDHVTNDFRFRFDEEGLNTFEFNIFFYSIFCSRNPDALTKSLQTITDYINRLHENMSNDITFIKLNSEFQLWKSVTQNDVKDGLDLFISCDGDMFPLLNNAYKYLLPCLFADDSTLHTAFSSRIPIPSQETKNSRRRQKGGTQYARYCNVWLHHPHQAHHISMLDISISNTLSWDDHVRSIAKAASQKLGFLLFPQIRPVLEYCSHIWGSAPKHTLMLLIQRRAICLMGDATLTHSLTSLEQHDFISMPLPSIPRKNIFDAHIFHRLITGYHP
ncbi:unnamed protein product [Phaedon cochleariae]|uniref:Uncharacterized protein n=1 Tax=Phaedon cochleariae TaxID=80249 RepID=A0A9N9SBY8_PHACE|nr:unnamed protein product [Phaedon cochleariae]